MKLLVASICAVAAFIAMPTVAAGQGAAPTIQSLDWLSGCWERIDEKRGMQITEMWMKPAGNAMIGAGRTIKSGKLIDFEFFRVVEEGSGLSFIARPAANKEDTTFKMIRSSADEIVFENPAHDFPQRIMYKRDGAKMTARIEGTIGGKLKGTDFPFIRVRCE
jgi:hypothetical protein